jgi:hypothetical protein
MYEIITRSGGSCTDVDVLILLHLALRYLFEGYYHPRITFVWYIFIWSFPLLALCANIVHVRFLKLVTLRYYWLVSFSYQNASHLLTSKRTVHSRNEHLLLYLFHSFLLR